MSEFKKIINRLFSQKVIVKRMPNNRLRVIDYDKLQSVGNNIVPNYLGVKSSLYGNSQYVSGYNQDDMVDTARMTMYMDYDAMESDAIIAAALDVYADEATVKDDFGNVLTINCEDDIKKRILHNLYFDILNVEFNLWHWIRTLCKYGDFFLYMNNVPGVGVVDVVPIHPSLIKRDDYSGEDGNQTQYRYEGEGQYSYSNVENTFEYHEIAHFRVLTDTDFLPYGKSLLEGARKVWKQLTMMEDAMLIHRIMRAPERRIFKIDVGNLPPESIDAYIEDISNSMKKIPYIDPQTGDYNLRFNLMNMLEDFFLPTRGGESGTEIDTLAGLTNDGNLEDIEYLQRKQMAYLKIPRAYLGYDEGVEGKGTLAAEDIKFARFIERIQKIVVSELEKIGQIHLTMQGYNTEDVIDFSLKLSTPSLIYERQKIDILTQKVSLVESLAELNILSRKWLYENIFNMSKDEWTAEQQLVIEDLKRKFREEQITSEGNDPLVSGESFGTPHDIVSMQVASKLSKYKDFNPQDYEVSDDDPRHDNPGRPNNPVNWETDRDPINGRDPTGRKTFQTTLTASKQVDKIKQSIGKLSLKQMLTEDVDMDGMDELVEKNNG